MLVWREKGDLVMLARREKGMSRIVSLIRFWWWWRILMEGKEVISHTINRAKLTVL